MAVTMWSAWQAGKTFLTSICNLVCTEGRYALPAGAGQPARLPVASTGTDAPAEGATPKPVGMCNECGVRCRVLLPPRLPDTEFLRSIRST